MPEHRVARRSFTFDEDEIIRDMFRARKPLWEIGAALDRQIGSIRARKDYLDRRDALDRECG